MQAQIFTFVIPAMALIYALVLGALWWQRRDQWHILAYSYCFGSIAAGVLVNIWIMGAVGALGIVVYHLLSMSGIIAMMWGTSRRVGQDIPIFIYGFTVVIACVLLAIAGSVDDIATMKLIQNTGSALLLALAAQNLWFAKKNHLVDHALVWVLALFSGFGFIRPVLTDLSIVLFGEGDQGIALLTSLHALLMTVMITLMALCLVSSVIADNMAEQRRKAEIDPLSGLRMRGAFEVEAEAMIERAHKAEVPVSMIIADIDHFKLINDRHGHLIGDKVIAEFGRLMLKAIRSKDIAGRSKDIAGRLGGEEFGLLLWNCDGEAAESMADRLRVQIHDVGSSIGMKAMRCSASFGVEQWSKNTGFSKVFERADANLYRAKNGGRNQVCGARKRSSSGSDEEIGYEAASGQSNVISIPKLGPSAR
ncbi:MAG: GGDEF domain-containing protein [Erythrobacter sp.]